MSIKPMADDLMTTKEVCDRLKISRQTMWNFRQQGMPIAFRTGRNIIRYNYVDVLNWMDKRNKVDN